MNSRNPLSVIAIALALASPWALAQESEADHIGVLLMAKAGYDPHESVALWQRMSQGGGSRGPEYLSTHPNPDTRIVQLQNWMPQAWQYYQNYIG